MPKGYEHPTPAALARRFYGTFTSILHTDHNIDEAPWDEVPEDIKAAFVEAMDMVVKEELEVISAFFEKEVGEQATKRAAQIVAEAPPAPKPNGEKVVCYYCEKRYAVKWYACEECLRS